MSAFAAGLDRCEAQENIVPFEVLFSKAHFYVATLMRPNYLTRRFGGQDERGR
jgi:hypothetical protein